MAKIDRIVVASVHDLLDMISWNGIPAHMSLAFEDAGVQVVPGGPLEVKEPPFYNAHKSRPHSRVLGGDRLREIRHHGLRFAPAHDRLQNRSLMPEDARLHFND
jgi:hypothetical protein